MNHKKPSDPLQLGVEAAIQRLYREIQKVEAARSAGRFSDAIGCSKVAIEIATALEGDYHKIAHNMKITLHDLRDEQAKSDLHERTNLFDSAVKYIHAYNIAYPKNLEIEQLPEIRKYLVELMIVNKGFCLWDSRIQASKKIPPPSISAILKNLPKKIEDGEQLLQAEIIGVFRYYHLKTHESGWSAAIRVKTAWGVQKVNILLPLV